MKIAAVTDDQRTVCPHFGRAAYYLVFTVENGEIVAREVRPKAGHRQFADSGHHDDSHAGHGHHGSHEHHHDHGHAGGHEHHHDHAHGRGFGDHADWKHAQMVESVQDCEVVLVRGMGQGARLALAEAGITPCAATREDAEEAVRAYLADGRGGDPECPSERDTRATGPPT